jgi:hypothetical protein
MNQSEKRGSLNRVSSKNRIPFGFAGTSAVLVVAIMGWCAAIQGAEIHEAAELGDLEKVKAYLEKDPKQINATDSKGRTVLGRAARSGKKELVNSCWTKAQPKTFLPQRLWARLTRLPLF